jgi:membrane protease YdiL (CAAX protease family)
LNGARLAAIAGPGVLLVVALLPGLRPAGAAILGLGWLVTWRSGRPAALAWAAALPIGAVLSWPWILGSDAPLGAAACVDPLSVIVVRRLAGAGAVIGLVAMLLIIHRSSPDELGLRRPRVGEGALALSGCLVLAAGGVLVGPAIARPFFGELDFPVPTGALVPAGLFALANGIVEEVGYRGAMQGWLARVSPMWAAIGFQGLVFGIVHAGPEVVALLPVHVALLAAVGVGAGLVRWRTGSLSIPIGIHVGADIALYVGLACRTPA